MKALTWTDPARRRSPRGPGLAGNKHSGRLFEEARREIEQTAAPCQPLMGRAGRFKVYVLNACFGQLLAEVLGVGSFDGSDAQEQQLHFFVECRGIGEHASTGGLGIESSTTTAAVAAESSQVGKLIEVRKYGQE